MKSSLRMIVASCALLALSSSAFGWGSYGHQQINISALKLIQNTPLGKCWIQSQELIQRLAISPDYDWKMVGKNPTDPKLLEKRRDNDRYEHPLHFFEADAFQKEMKANPDAIIGLPDQEYAQAFPLYQKLLSQNSSFVEKMDPSKKIENAAHPTVHDVTEHGTAPWRIIQLFDLGVQALKQKDMELATLYLGTMGHYVGDMSQSFHATLNYDGQASIPPANGIHHTFEEAIFEELVKNKKKLEEAKIKTPPKLDHETNLWSSFELTESAVLASAQQLIAEDGLEGLNRSQVVPEVFKLIADGYPYIDPLIENFTKAMQSNLKDSPIHECPAEHSDLADSADSAASAASLAVHRHPPTPKIPVAAIEIFTDMPVTTPGQELDGLSVLQVAEDRLGASAALLARIWVSAYAAAGSPSLEKCEKMSFNLAQVIENYPKPEYLPK